MMALERLSVFGNPNIGVYIIATDKYAIVPPGLTPKTIEAVSSTLGIEPSHIVETRIAGTVIIGVMAAGNSNGILLPRIVREEEVEAIRRVLDVNVAVLESRSTAIGNIVLANDKAALVYPRLEEPALKTVRDTLGVEVEQRTIVNIPTVGSVAVITNKGGLIHPDVSDQELDFLSQFFGVPLDVGTVNFGVPFIKTGLVANSRGALIGEQTTGPELMRIQKALNLER